jgi:F-type H+-transporting ATPase subunit delta
MQFTMTEAAHHTTVLDATQQQIGKVYAEALYGAVAKTGNVETVRQELQSLVADVLKNLPKLDAVLQSPRVSHEEKVKILDTAFQGRMSKELLTFLKVVSRHGRLESLRAMQRAFEKVYNERAGRVEVIVRTAEPLTEDLRGRIANRLRQALQREPVLHVEVDPELIGGVVIRIGDTVYDGSVARQLVRLREETASSIAREIRRNAERFAIAE